MKKIIISMIIVLSVANIVSAQNSAPNPSTPQGIQQTSINGKLAFVNGRIAVQDASAVYYASGINQLIGFVDGLKEGAAVTLDGFLFPASPSAGGQFFRTSKLTFNGKTYDISAGQANRMAQNFHYNQTTPYQGMMGPGQWGYPYSQQHFKSRKHPKKR